MAYSDILRALSPAPNFIDVADLIDAVETRTDTAEADITAIEADILTYKAGYYNLWSYGSQTLSSTSYADLTGISQSITTTANDIVVFYLNMLAQPATAGDVAVFQILRNSTTLRDTAVTLVTASQIYSPSIFYIDKPGAGTFTYKAQGKNNTAARNIYIMNRQCMILKLRNG